MCARADKEPLMQYWFRQFKEEPLRVLILATMAAMVYLYQDGKTAQEQARQDDKAQNAALMESIQAQTKAFMDVSAQLQLINNRLEHLEREHENMRPSN
ncbi:MAG: hypothetical protein IKZ07_05555 [Akkermansia sp.]|nr:hypothetical protein [Akkermansia sp.]